MILHLFRAARSVLREHAKARRSPRWKHLRDEWLKEHPTCAACGSRKRVQVHHKKPFHMFPSLELDPKNLVSLCMSRLDCHLILGHAGDWDARNPNVEQDVANFSATLNPYTRKSVRQAARLAREYD